MSGPRPSGAVCACGAVLFGPAPVVHEFLRTHPMTSDPRHVVAVCLPGRPPYDQVAELLDQVRAVTGVTP